MTDDDQDRADELDQDQDGAEVSLAESGERDTLHDPQGTADDDEDQQDPAEDGDEDHDEGDEGETFPRPYVERLRARSAGYRTRANAAEARAAELEQALFTERVRALDVLADPTDLPFDADMLDDPDALRAAVDALVAKRPHYRRRGTTTPGATGSRDRRAEQDAFSLTGIMRGHS